MKLLIREGDRSEQVTDVQARLRALGIAVDDDPGLFGPATKEAVRAFQQRRGILADGVVGPNTWNELVDASWRLGDRALYLRYPLMRGDDVLTLQSRLNALGFDAGREDGIFGGDTHRAVLGFQREYGVAGDGIFGPRSFAALVGLRADRPQTAASLREEIRLSERGDIDEALVILDPGHGGDDAGGRAANGTREADLCWDIARRVAVSLVSRGAQVRFTRTEVESLESSERAARANDLDADVFVSIHLNSHDDARAGGTSTYFFGKSRAGEHLAEAIQVELVRLGLGDCRTHPQSYQLLRETRMPAVIVEPCFITNPTEARRLEDADFRAALAEAIGTGIWRHFDRPHAELVRTE